MSTDSAQIVAMAWKFAHVLRDAGLSDMAYTEQITFLLFLKMADELTKSPHNQKARVTAFANLNIWARNPPSPAQTATRSDRARPVDQRRPRPISWLSD